jgi:hypothetical protein
MLHLGPHARLGAVLCLLDLIDDTAMLAAGIGEILGLRRHLANGLALAAIGKSGRIVQSATLAAVATTVWITLVALSTPICAFTFDKFHAIKIINEAVDAVRHAEQKRQVLLRGTRYIWLRNPNNLSEQQRDTPEGLPTRHLKTGRAYQRQAAIAQCETSRLWSTYWQASSTCNCRYDIVATRPKRRGTKKKYPQPPRST